LQLLPKVATVHLLDPLKGMLDKFESDVAPTGYRNYVLHNGTIDQFTFPPLDFVTCSASLHHTPSIPDALARIFCALKPGGRLFAIEKKEICEEFLGQLKNAGFTDIAYEHHTSVNVTLPDGTAATWESNFYSAVRPLE
jgi:ubiquinone/menaquinone biosynthesis C-methylase UbiE